ncbi:MAG: hypothetical protein QHC90_00030 [Shinella sp.]|nr:hypothetical protein [Shinella sp.]
MPEDKHRPHSEPTKEPEGAETKKRQDEKIDKRKKDETETDPALLPIGDPAGMA